MRAILLCISLAFPVVAQESQTSCAVTRPTKQSFIPSAPYAANTPEANQFWFGSAKLWTALPADGVWRGGKIAWFRQGYDWKRDLRPKLLVSSKLLAASPVETKIHVGIASHRPEDRDVFIESNVDVPVTGCWEISAQYGNDKLSFVVWVAP